MIDYNYSAAYLRSVLEAFKDLVFVFSADGVILDYLQDEKTDLLYVPKEQFIGRHHSEVLPAAVGAKIDEAISDIKNGTPAVSFEYELLAGGRMSWFAAVFSEIRDPAVSTPKYLCVVREVTAKKERELLLTGILDNAFNAFIVLRPLKDAHGKVVDFEWVISNPRVVKLTGRRLPELQGKRISELPEQPWVLFRKYARVIETGKTLDVEHCFESEKKKKWALTHASKLGENLLITVMDITRRKNAELGLQTAITELKLNRQQMDLFFTQAVSGFFFMMLDQPITWNDSVDKTAALDYAFSHLSFTRVNDALLKQYGATRKEFMKLKPSHFFKDAAEGKATLRQLFDNKRIHVNRLSKRMDGAEIWLEGDYICFTGEKDQIPGYFGIQRDVTARRNALALLQQSEERYRLLANNMLDMVALHDPDGVYRYISPSVTKILGYTTAELLNTTPYLLFHPDDIQSIREQSHTKAREGNEIANVEYRIRKKDGTYIWFSTNTKPITDASGKVVMLQTVSREVTERIEMLHALEELNHQKNKLFSIIAHDMRAPLANCMSLLNRTQKEMPKEELEKYLQLARKSSFNLYELMDDLLLWAGSQLDKVSFDPILLNVNAEIESVARRFPEVAQSKDIAISFVFEDDPMTIFADREMVRTIIRNLLSNAIKFTHPGGRITIETRKNNGMVEISVQDNGIGIKRENLEKLFSKTSNFTTYGTSGEKGTGLGLDLCKDFVDKHAGKIWAESEEGKGSKFTVAFTEF